MPWPDWSDFEGVPIWFWIGLALFTALVWFVPTFIAVFRNRASLRPIAILNVPGGLSWIVWTALIVWAVSGKGPPPDLATNARKNWPWLAVIGLVVAAALIWYFMTRGSA